MVLHGPAGAGDPNGPTSVIAEVEPGGPGMLGDPEVQRLGIFVLGHPLDDEKSIGERLLRCGLAGPAEELAGHLGAQ